VFRCTTKDYDHIYAPWLVRGIDLLDWSGWRPNQTLLDLCGGTGTIAKKAITLGAEHPVHLFDLNPRCHNTHGVIQTKGDANHVGHYYEPKQFDVVVCRQAIAYLDPNTFFGSVAKTIKPGGQLVFNTFWAPPPVVGFKSMVFDSAMFAEAHIRLFGRITHLQARIEFPPKVDVSLFRYHPPACMWMQMSQYFEMNAKYKGKSVYIRGLRT